MNKKLSTYVLLTLLACVGCSSTNSKTIPKQLVGLWTTDAPRYRGRFLELHEAYIIVGTGDGAADMQRVSHVESKAADYGTIYTIYSKDAEDMENQLSIIFKNDDGGQLYLANQNEMIWKKCKGEQCGVEDKITREDPQQTATQ